MKLIKFKLNKFLFGIVPLLISILLSTSYGKTINVPADYSTIASAVSNALSGDVIIIAPWTYHEHGILIDKELTITSNYYTTGDEQYISQTIINGDRNTIFENVQNLGINVEISGLKFINAYKPIIINDLAFIKHNIFSDNGSDSISFEANGYGYVSYNTIENSSDDGIDIDGKKGYYTIEHNSIRNNGDDGIEIRLHRYSGPEIKYTINNNVFSGMMRMAFN